MKYKNWIAAPTIKEKHVSKVKKERKKDSNIYIYTGEEKKKEFLSFRFW